MRGLAFAAAITLFVGSSAGAATFTISDMMSDGQQSQTLDGTRASLTTANATSWAQTSVGVNKLYSSVSGVDNAIGTGYVSSIWGDNFTVASTATGPVTIRFTVGIDGTAAGTNPETAFNYYLKAIRGSVDSMPTGSGSTIGQIFSDVSAQQQIGTVTRSVRLDDRNLVRAFNSADGTTVYLDDKRAEGGYFESSPNPGVAPVRLFSDHIEYKGPTGQYVRVPNSGGGAYAAAAANFMVLDSTTLCPVFSYGEGGCGNGTFGTHDAQRTLSLEFTLNPGDSFFVMGGLMVENQALGTIDFGATAKLTQVVAFNAADPTQLVSLQSDSNQIVANTDTPIVAAAAVPEPATWAMFIGGFGLIGGTMRRRRTVVRFA